MTNIRSLKGLVIGPRGWLDDVIQGIVNEYGPIMNQAEVGLIVGAGPITRPLCILLNCRTTFHFSMEKGSKKICRILVTTNTVAVIYSYDA